MRRALRLACWLALAAAIVLVAVVAQAGRKGD